MIVVKKIADAGCIGVGITAQNCRTVLGVFKSSPSDLSYGLRLLHYALGTVIERLSPLGREAVEIYGKKKIGIIIKYRSEVIVYRILIVNQGVSLPVTEFDFGIPEVEKRCGVRTVVHRPRQLKLQLTFYPVVGILRYCKKQTAFYLLVRTEDRITEFCFVHIG